MPAAVAALPHPQDVDEEGTGADTTRPADTTGLPLFSRAGSKPGVAGSEEA